ncbi:MAG: hypothetical protein H6573_21835 [Lewinellaceae bacterium]|nr:hypothetical protein [Phaeodactylibacter sp.]MCB9350124.1 hypothetical protein [Lewinellaceae bacterium]
MRLLLISALLAWAMLVQAQDFEGGIGIGGLVYGGDLSPKILSRYTRFVEPAGSVVFRYRNRGVLGIRGSITYGNLTGDDARSAYPTRKLSFQTSLLEAAVVGEWYLIPDNFLGDSPKITPYLFGGVAVFHFDPEAQFESGYVALQPVGTEGQGLEYYERPYNRTQIAIPVGAGLRMIMSKRGALSLEISARKLFTDYLDDVTGAILDYDQIYDEKGELAARLSRPDLSPQEAEYITNLYRRGGDWYDGYVSFGLTYTYRVSR